MITANEGIGLGICLTVAMALVSYLLYLKASSQGHSSRGIGWGLVIIWLCLGAAVAVLIGARAAVGGALFSVSLGQGKVWWRSVGVDGVALLAEVVAVLGLLLYIALRVAHILQEPASPRKNDPTHPAAP